MPLVIILGALSQTVVVLVRGPLLQLATWRCGIRGRGWGGRNGECLGRKLSGGGKGREDQLPVALMAGTH